MISFNFIIIKIIIMNQIIIVCKIFNQLSLNIGHKNDSCIIHGWFASNVDGTSHLKNVYDLSFTNHFFSPLQPPNILTTLVFLTIMHSPLLKQFTFLSLQPCVKISVYIFKHILFYLGFYQTPSFYYLRSINHNLHLFISQAFITYTCTHMEM